MQKITFTPRIKNVKNAFLQKIKTLKNVIDKLTILIKPNEKIPSKINSLVSYDAHDNVRQLQQLYVSENFL